MGPTSPEGIYQCPYAITYQSTIGEERFYLGGERKGSFIDMKAMICVYFDGKKCRAVREKINFISMHQPNASDEGVMRGCNVYERVGASVVVVKDCIGSAIIYKSGKQISIW